LCVSEGNRAENRYADGNKKGSVLISRWTHVSSNLTGFHTEKLTGFPSFGHLNPQTSSSTGFWAGSTASNLSIKSEKSHSTSLGYDLGALRHFVETNSGKKVPPGEYTCEICGKVYSIRQHLSRHYSVHTGERMFFCTLCRKDFRLKHHLKEHLILVHKKTPQDTEPFIQKKHRE
jgi:uncharacterized Zn-finger protein